MTRRRQTLLLTVLLVALPVGGSGCAVIGWVFNSFAPKPKVEVLTIEGEQGRPGIIYLPYGIARSWHLGGKRAAGAYAVGTGIYFYVTQEARRMYDRAHPEVVKPTPATPTPGAPAPVGPGGAVDEE